MKTILIICTLAGLFSACKSTPNVVPVAERIQKSWSAQSVKENSTTAYTRGATTNTRPGYASFQLTLNNGGTAVFVDYDGVRCTGTWTISADEKTLTLNGLTPQPSGTNGTISFTINALTANQLTITRTTASLKTGGSINVYELSNP